MSRFWQLRKRKGERKKRKEGKIHPKKYTF